MQRLETLAGRKLGTVRVFYKWDQPFPTDYEKWLKTTGHTLVISVKARRLDGTTVRQLPQRRSSGEVAVAAAAHRRAA